MSSPVPDSTKERSRPKRRHSYGPDDSDGERRQRRRRDATQQSRVKEEEHSQPRQSGRVRHQPVIITEKQEKQEPSVKKEECESQAGGVDEGQTETEKEKPSFEPSGLLAAETNQVNGTLLKHVSPPESRSPTKRWRLYVFKAGEEDAAKVLHVSRAPTYLFGKDIRVADVPVMHPTISAQHAVLQYRLHQGNVLPYLMDLNSTNGTMLNGERVAPARYIELREKDSIRFGHSTREYVLLHDSSGAENQDDA